MKKIRVLFVEDDGELAERLKPHYQSFFLACGYESVFLDATGEGPARKLIESDDPHILICDLGLDKEFSGLHTIRVLRTNFPDLFVIGTSRGEPQNKIIDSRQPNFHMFIDKKALLGGDRRYIDVSRKRFLDAFHIETGIRIANLDNLSARDFQKPAVRRELLSLVRQIMFSGHLSDELMHPDEITLEPLSGGFSGSHVFKMISRNSRSGIICVPAVLKISLVEYAEQELDNYHRFVKWGLPYTWRVDLLGHGYTKTYGAIAYSFILSDLKKFESLTDALRRKEDKRVINVIETLFSPEMRRWYGDPLIRLEDNIVERYAGRYFRGTDSQSLSEKRFSETIHRAFNARVTDNNIIIGSRSFSQPMATLFGYPMGQYRSCICHGDLNSNNVIIAENAQTIFIDFQETGRGHVFEDFVTMEASVRLYHGDEGPCGEKLIEADVGLSDGDDVAGLGPAHLIIAQIRRLAKKNFPSEAFQTYYYAVAAFHFRLLRIANLSDGQAERVASAVLAGLHNLVQSRVRTSRKP